MPDHVSADLQALASRRIVVISSSLAAGANDLWDAVRPYVGHLTVVGGHTKEQHVSIGAGTVALRQVSGDQVRSHLVGLRRCLRDLKPDLVHLNGELWSVTAQEALSLRLPLVVHGAENLWAHGGRIEQLVRDRLVRRAVGRISGYGSWNRDGAAYVAELARRRGMIMPTLVLPAIIPGQAFRTQRWHGAPTNPQEPLRVLLVGQALAKKGFDTILDAAASVNGSCPRISLAGSGPDLAALVEQAAALGVDFTPLGSLAPAELARIMAESHVLVQPSRTTHDWAEQFGRSVAEAMTVGLPCLVSDSGELPHVVGDQPAAVFPENDVHEVARRLADLSGSPNLLERLSTEQTQIVQSYSPTVSAEHLAAFWAAVIP